MKKVLFSGAAAAALVLGFVASAQAADPVKLEIGGYANQFFGYADNKKALGLVNVDEQDDVEIDFKGSSKLDNGLTVAVEVDTNGSQGRTNHSTGSNGAGKKSFVSVAGAFGAVELGEQDNVGFLIHNSSPDVGGLGGQDGSWNQWVVAPLGFADFRQRTYAGDDRSANKIIYVSPTLAGFTAGFSYTPSIDTTGVGTTTMPTNNGGSVGCANSATSATPNINGGAIANAVGGACLNGDLYVYGVSYAHAFGDLSVKADIGSGNANVAGLNVYQGGLNLTYKGFTLGGSILDRDTKNGTTTFTSVPVVSTAVVNKAIAAGKGTSWDAGLSYVTGPPTSSAKLPLPPMVRSLRPPSAMTRTTSGRWARPTTSARAWL